MQTFVVQDTKQRWKVDEVHIFCYYNYLEVSYLIDICTSEFILHYLPFVFTHYILTQNLYILLLTILKRERFNKL